MPFIPQGEEHLAPGIGFALAARPWLLAEVSQRLNAVFCSVPSDSFVLILPPHITITPETTLGEKGPRKGPRQTLCNFTELRIVPTTRYVFVISRHIRLDIQ